jgi:tetratricopeptide (TPR) repeat protein
MRRNVIIALLLAGITLVLYWPANHFDLVDFDDPLFITETPEINSGFTWHSLAWAFTGIVAANWHPVTNLTFLLTHQFWGANPGVEHCVNSLLHAANAVLLFLLLFRMTGATWRSALAAALFAWHPLRVESVAWIAERKDVLSGFFFLLTLLAYARYAKLSGAREPGGKASYLWSLLFFSLGLMSKAMLVTLPFVLLLLDVWPLKRVANLDVFFAKTAALRLAAVKTALPIFKGLLLEKAPYFVLTILFCALTYWVQQTHAAVSALQNTGWDTRLGNVILSYVRYLGKTVWPADLAILYPFPTTEHSYLALWPGWEIALVAGAMVLFSGWCVWQLPRRPYLAVGWFWYVGTMLPVIGLVQVGGQGMADRYSYIPLIGPVITLAWLTAEFFGSEKHRIIVVPTAIVILGACAWATQNQLNYWRDTVTLFTHAVNVTGDNFLAQEIIGNGYENEGKMAEAAEHYRAAIDLCPTSKQAYQALGHLQEKNGDWAAAATTYDSALGIDPGDSVSHLGLASVLPHLGRSREAVGHLESALKDTPDAPEILNNLAWTLATNPEADLRNGTRAVQLAERACALTHFQNTVMIGTLAAAYAETGRFDDAIATAQKACANASAKGETDLLATNRALLALYQQHKPYHETTEKPAATAP